MACVRTWQNLAFTRKKSKIWNFPITEWEESNQESFSSIIKAITNQVIITVTDCNKCIYLYTNVSSTHWAVAPTQVDRKEIVMGSKLSQQ